MYKINKLPKSQIEILFELPFAELEKFYKEAILEFGQELKIEGFRSGHIPEKIIEQKVGKMAILEEAAEHAIQENYRKAILENKITPVSQPQVEITKLAPGNPLEFKILVFVLPEIKLPDYKKIAAGVKRKEIFVAEKEVEDSLSWLQKSRAKFSPKFAPSQPGDFVEIEYSSPQIENGKIYQDAFLLGEGHFVDGFEKNLEGIKDAEEKEFAVKDKNFKVKVKSVQRAELPELNDDFAKGLGKFGNLADLKKNIKEGISLEKEKEESQRIRAEILDKISEAVVCEIPEALTEQEKSRMQEEQKARILQTLQMSFEEYLKKINKSEKELLDSFSEPAKKRVLGSLVLRELAQKENIEVKDQEIKEEMDRFLEQYPDIKTAKNQFDEERLKEYIKDAIVNEKIFKLLESFINQ